ncbi:CNP1-like family protein [Ramlibacter rhizophilus]|uniref:CNP1-like uncharacterized domain-containing protein n=1 Tax=Ramlibacter rhizophilus TaxID=1781167 RepID=A0A4Z0BU93_9BURK|nr:CNP1-like family protein [Ramlibacter rhizophilus]TFZ01575.1 hypothetical protein EZ242_09410 [Ramlibacter rhizophilus]
MSVRRHGLLAWAGAALMAGCASPLLAQEPWQEGAAPEPPALRLKGLVPVELPRSTLRFGVQPDSVSIGPDRVVRYVVVATSASGALNALYEGIRCDEGKVKVYARHTPGAGWTPTRDAPWESLHDNAGHRHSLAIARSGACIGRGTNTSAERVLRDLAAPVDERFRIELR